MGQGVRSCQIFGERLMHLKVSSGAYLPICNKCDVLCKYLQIVTKKRNNALFRFFRECVSRTLSLAFVILWDACVRVLQTLLILFWLKV